MDIKDSQKALVKAFKDNINRITFKGAKRMVSGSRAEFLFPNGTVVVLGYATVKRGLPKGQFAVYSFLSVKDGPIYQIMDKTHLAKSGSFWGKGLLRATSHGLIKPGNYHIRNGTEIEKVAKQILKDMEKVFTPIVRAFTGGYPKAFNFVLKSRGKYVRNPFTLCVILLVLDKSLGKLDVLINEAGKYDSFYDFKKVKDIRKQIVTPVTEWLKRQC
jgi:hypothetical protein